MNQVLEDSPECSPTEVRQSLGHLLLSAGSALGVATLIERGLTFLANLAAARFGGSHLFGAYSVALTTANNVASYAGAGIGTTANRFSGEYPYGSSGYAGLLRTLSFVSVVSALLAAVILWFTAGPLALHLLRNPGLTELLKFAALSSGAIILLECLRGLLVGQRRFTALVALSSIVGIGMAIMLPVATRFGASAMVLSQATVAMAAISICILAARGLGFAPPAANASRTAGPAPFFVVRFGLIQLSGMVGLNAAGWWLASLVARADSTLTQVGWYSIAMQLRNMCAMPSSLISQTAYAQLSDVGAQEYGGAHRVTVVSTAVASIISLIVAGPVCAILPWAVPQIFGRDFAGAELAATFAIATGLVHMSAAPAAARLTVVSLPVTGIINGGWSLLLIGLGTWLVPKGGAKEAVVCFLAAHLFAAIAVLVALRRSGAAPRELIMVTLPSLTAAVVLAVLGYLRTSGSHKIAISFVILATTLTSAVLTFHQGRLSYSCLAELNIRKMASGLWSRLTSRTNRVRSIGA